MAVELGLLGEMTAQVHGREMDLVPARQRCMLAALAVDAGREVPVEWTCPDWTDRVDQVWSGYLT